MGVIKCCNGCKPPKRNPYCHIDCPEYLAEKAAYEERKAEEDARKNIERGLDYQMARSVWLANKRWRVN